ncbi:MAG TPA: Ku protein [Frankiaceae bacterium]
MRSIWKGAVSFGLVTIPVRLYSATEQKDVAFHQVRRTDGSRIRYQRVAVADDEPVDYGDIAKGFELPGGDMVVLTDEDLAQVPVSSSHSIEVLEFVPLEQVDPIYFSKSYYLEPDGAGVKPYVLLRQALEASGKVAIVKVTLRQREALATLRIRENVFVLETMLWPDEIRKPDFKFLDEDVSVRPQELAMASSLIESLTADFDPSEYTDSYREALQQVIDAKVAGREVVTPPGQEEEGGQVLDLLAALRASVAAAAERRGAPPGAAAADAAEEDKPARRTAKAAKAPAARSTTKTAAAKAPAKRAAAKAAKAPAKTAASSADSPTARTKAPAKAGRRKPAA